MAPNLSVSRCMRHSSCFFNPLETAIFKTEALSGWGLLKDLQMPVRRSNATRVTSAAHLFIFHVFSDVILIRGILPRQSLWSLSYHHTLTAPHFGDEIMWEQRPGVMLSQATRNIYDDDHYCRPDLSPQGNKIIEFDATHHEPCTYVDLCFFDSPTPAPPQHFLHTPTVSTPHSDLHHLCLNRKSAGPKNHTYVQADIIGKRELVKGMGALR